MDGTSPQPDTIATEEPLDQTVIPEMARAKASLIKIDSGTSQYSDDQRREAVGLYIRHGVIRRVSERLGIPETTIHLWKQQAWWEDIHAAICSAVEDELRAGLREVSLEGTRQALSQLQAGEVKGKDAMIIASIAYDKLRLSENRPGKITADSRVDSLAEQLAKLSGQVNAKVVSEQ